MTDRLTLTRRTVKAAIACIDAHAEALRQSHALAPDFNFWPKDPMDQRAKREYQRMRRLLKALREA